MLTVRSCPFADDAHRHRGAGLGRGDHRDQLVAVGERLAVVCDDDVSGFEARLSAAPRLDDVLTTAPSRSFSPILVDRLAVDIVDRMPMRPRVILPVRSCGSSSRTMLIGIAKPMPMLPCWPLVGVDGRVDADDLAAEVQQRPAGVAGVDGRVGLDHAPLRDAIVGQRESRPMPLMTPTLTVCERPNGLPIAITQSPGWIWDESPNLISGSGWSGFLGQLDQRAVGQRIAADDPRFVQLILILAVERHLNRVAPSTTWLFVRMRPDLSMMNPVPAACTMRSRGRGACRAVSRTRPAEEPLEQVVTGGSPSLLRRRRVEEILRALPGLGADVDHRRRHVLCDVAEGGRVNGAAEWGVVGCRRGKGLRSGLWRRPRRDASTIPTMIDASAISSP